MRSLGQLPQFTAYSTADLWAAITRKRDDPTAAGEDVTSLKSPEWQVFSGTAPFPSTPDFRVSEVPVPDGFAGVLSRVLLVERLRLVSVLIGFTRLVCPGDYGDVDEIPPELIVPLSRRDPRWVPAAEVRGEGIFLRFDEAALQRWLARPEVVRRDRLFSDAHRRWRQLRHLQPPEALYPGLRYVLLHSFAHAFMRQLALECGYTAASLCERIYSLAPEAEDGPLAGVLIYTAAPDSEGTLGGLVSLGTPDQLGRHLRAALDHMRWCASDPLCAEHDIRLDANALHAAACHACLFAPETACEHGNEYLDRSVLVPTVAAPDMAFFTLDRPT